MSTESYSTESAAGESASDGRPTGAEATQPSPRTDAILDGWAHSQRRSDRHGDPLPELPTLPSPPEDVDAADVARLVQGARRFHLADRETSDELHVPADDLVPALLHLFRKPSQIRHEFPLVLLPADDERIWAPVTEVLSAAIEAAPADDDAPALRDNLPRLELHLREVLRITEGLEDAAPALERAAEAMRGSGYVSEARADRLHASVLRLVASMPEGSVLLPLCDRTPLHLLLHVARRRGAARLERIRDEGRALRNDLQDLLAIDRTKSAGEQGSDTLAQTVGMTGAAHFDPKALARILGQPRGSASLSDDRRRRITETIDTLQRFIADPAPSVIAVHRDDAAPPVRPDGIEWRPAPPGGVSRLAAAVFDELAAAAGRVFAAMRVASLELESAYDSARHDALMQTFDWHSFSREELLAMPVVVAVESAEDVSGVSMPDLSRLLVSGRPVKILVTTSPISASAGDPDVDPLLGAHLELSYLGISHRDAFVSQSTAARPQHLIETLDRSLETARPALHVVATGLAADGTTPPLGAWLHGGAALEGRAHPLLQYDPEAGATWARRLDFSRNPALDADWPTYDLPVRRHTGAEESISVAFTFADFALMEPACRCHFRVLPPEVVADDLRPLAEYLDGPASDALHGLPFIWSADERGVLHRLLVSRRLAFACRDRLDYWRTLQELAGVRNEHIREAVAEEHARLQAIFADERARLAQAHAEAVERTRKSAAGEAMQRLAHALVSAEPGALLGPAVPAAPPEVETTPKPEATPAPVTAPAPAPEPEPEPEPEASAAPATPPVTPEAEEPWIQSVLCTSCNDCMAINARLFVYNSNKQAIIGDPRAGTYAQLVKAAELCPARCIHPGTPLDPDEPDLETLIRRAEPFQ